MTPRARRGNGKDTRGTAYVVYEDIYDAKAAADHLSGFNVNNRYLICLYFSPKVMSGKARPTGAPRDSYPDLRLCRRTRHRRRRSCAC